VLAVIYRYAYSISEPLHRRAFISETSQRVFPPDFLKPAGEFPAGAKLSAFFHRHPPGKAEKLAHDISLQLAYALILSYLAGNEKILAQMSRQQQNQRQRLFLCRQYSEPAVKADAYNLSDLVKHALLLLLILRTLSGARQYRFLWTPWKICASA